MLIHWIIVSWIIMLILNVPMSRRVLVAWSAWIWCRWQWRHKNQSVKRWLWIVTLRHADGTIKIERLK